MKRALGGIALAAVLDACAFSPGRGFATLEPSRVSAPAALSAGRLDPTGRWKTNSGHRVTVTGGKILVEIAGVALQAPGAAAAAGSGGGTFDPANPPPRYSLCHNGHCHRDDGALVDYADIQAELSSGGAPAPPRTVVTLGPAVIAIPLVGASLGESRLADCAPNCFLPQTAISRAVLYIARLRAEGTIATATPDAPVRAWRLDLPLPGASLATDVKATVSVTGPARYELDGRFILTDKLFDGLPLERLLQGTGAPIDLAADRETAESLVANFAKSSWTAQLNVPI